MNCVLFSLFKDEEGWEWLEEDQALHAYQLPVEVIVTPGVEVSLTGAEGFV